VRNFNCISKTIRIKPKILRRVGKLKTKKMKKTILLSLMCTICMASIFAQTNDSIVIKKKQFYLNEKKLTINELKMALNSKPESAAEYKQYSSNMNTANVIVGAGTVLCLTGVVIMYLTPNDTSNPPKFVLPVLAGCGLVCVGIPFLLISNNHFKKSITLYNSKRSSTSFINESKLDIGLTQSGIGIGIIFRL
jgi:hypothetical protein